MEHIRLHRGAGLLVCDGRKALILVNEGFPGHEALRVAQEQEQELPSHTADMGTDRPGLMRQAAGPGSDMEQADWHEAMETEFLRDVAAAFTDYVVAQHTAELVIVAPPRALATLRRLLPSRILDHVVAQIDKDLTKHPVHEMQKVLFG